MIDVIVNQSPLGLADGLFDCVKLLGEVEAGPPLTEHFNHPTEMALGTLQPLDDIWVSFMNVILCHTNIVSPRIGYRKGSLSHRGCHFMPQTDGANTRIDADPAAGSRALCGI
jgi:hypothetical protein